MNKILNVTKFSGSGTSYSIKNNDDGTFPTEFKNNPNDLDLNMISFSGKTALKDLIAKAKLHNYTDIKITHFKYKDPNPKITMKHIIYKKPIQFNIGDTVKLKSSINKSKKHQQSKLF